MIKNFADTDTVLQSGRVLAEMTTQLVNQVFRLHDKGPTDPKKTYSIEDEILAKGSMHQIKDAKGEERKT